MLNTKILTMKKIIMIAVFFLTLTSCSKKCPECNEQPETIAKAADSLIVSRVYECKGIIWKNADVDLGIALPKIVNPGDNEYTIVVHNVSTTDENRILVHLKDRIGNEFTQYGGNIEKFKLNIPNSGTINYDKNIVVSIIHEIDPTNDDRIRHNAADIFRQIQAGTPCNQVEISKEAAVADFRTPKACGSGVIVP